MDDIYSERELHQAGFKSVGINVVVSKDARFFAVIGELGNNVRIDAYSILTGQIILKENVHISPFCFLGGTGGKISMGKGSGLSAQVSIFTKSDHYDNRPKRSSEKLTGDVNIGENSIVGAGSTIMPGTNIGKNVRVGCHSVINKNIDDGSVVVSRSIGFLNLSEG